MPEITSHIDPDLQAIADGIALPDYTISSIRTAVVALLNGLKSVQVPDVLDFTPPSLPPVPADPTFGQMRDFCANAHDALVQIGAATPEE